MEADLEELKGRTVRGGLARLCGQAVISALRLGFVVVMAGTLFGTLYWATGILERRLDQFEKNSNIRFELIDKRFEHIDKRIDQVEKNMNARFEDMNARFEDLKQVVLSKR